MADSLKSMALQGLGVAWVPQLSVRGELARGELVQPTPHWAPQCGLVHAVFASRRGLLPSVRHLLGPT